MEFVKMHATGNDFILFNGDNNLEFKQNKNAGDMIRRLCDRHFGVGGDGVMFTESSDIADIKMNYYNSDGSIAELCGNGIRCFAKYVFKERLVIKDEFDIETLAGIKRVKLSLSETKIEDISVNIGKPEFRTDMIPVKTEKKLENGIMLEEEIDIDGQKIKIYIVRAGVPHAVTFMDKIDDSDIEFIGERIENHKLFPGKINVNFAKINNRENIDVFTWERGSGRTLSCGTGACASVIVGVDRDLLNRNIIVKTDGGDLRVEIKNDYDMLLSGEAKTVFRGIIENRKL